VFLILAAQLTLRFFRTGGRQMLAMMGGHRPMTEPPNPLRPTATVITTSSPKIDVCAICAADRATAGTVGR